MLVNISLNKSQSINRDCKELNSAKNQQINIIDFDQSTFEKLQEFRK